MEVTLSRSNKVQKLPDSILTSCWTPRNELLVHESHRRPKESCDNIETAVELVHLKWNCSIFESSWTRKLISEACTLFTSLNSTSKKDPSLSGRHSDVIKFSRKYRSVIRSCVESLASERNGILSSIRDNGNNESEDDKAALDLLSRLIETFSEVEIAWYLCEILFLDVHPPGILVNQLTIWIQWHFTENNTRAEKVLQSGDPAHHPSYWQAINGFLLRGETDMAKALLELLVDPGSKEYTSVIIELLERMPRYSFGQLSHEFDMKWTSWSQECHEILSTGFFNNKPEFLTILKILCGDSSAIISARNPESTWFSLIPPLILYRDPFMKDTDLSSLSREVLSAFKPSANQQSSFDLCLLSAFDYDVMEVIRQACCFQDNWWFAAHFVDLLSAGNHLKSHNVEDESKLRESLILDFADGLMTYSSFWSTGVTYYDSCARLGSLRLELVLDRIPLESEKKANQVLEIVSKRKLKHLFRSLCRCISQKWLLRGNLSSALIWSIKSEDSQMCTFIADGMLRKYVETSSLTDYDILSSLGTKMLISDRLTFLAKYHEFLQIRAALKNALAASKLSSGGTSSSDMDHDIADKGKAAGELLITLIASNISPAFLRPILLLDALKLLHIWERYRQERKNKLPSIIAAEQVCLVMSALEDTLDLKEEDICRKEGDDDKPSVPDAYSVRLKELRSQERRLRLCLSKVLAHSCVL